MADNRPPTMAETAQKEQATQPEQVSRQEQLEPHWDRTVVHIEPGTHQAIFSTHLGRRSPRSVPTEMPPNVRGPYTIARSGNFEQAVADAAHYWFSKYPAQYMCFFPQCDHTIHDLWDDNDIATEAETFLEQVLLFITRENVHSAFRVAREWSKAYPDSEGLRILGGDLSGHYDLNDHLAIVDKIFVYGDTNRFPRIFLWHVANIMRTTMINLGLPRPNAQGSAQPVPEQQPPRTENEGHAREISLAKRPVIVGTAMPPTTQPARPVPLPVQPIPSPPTAQDHAIGQAQPLPRHLLPMGSQEAMNSPPGQPASLRPQKNRGSRQGSGSYGLPIPRTWGENYPGQQPHQPRQPSGPVSAMQSPRYANLMPVPGPMGPQLPMNPANTTGPMGSYHQGPQGPAMMVPPMMAPPSMPPLQAGPFSPHMDFVQPNYPSMPPPGRGMPIGDMTNTQTYGPPPPLDPRSMSRRLSQNNKPSLYNPYPEKPEYSNRRMSRSSFSNPPGGRKVSVGSHSRPSYGQHPFDNGPYPGNRPPDGSFGRNSSNNKNREVDLTITGNRLSGCNEYHIGPENTKVTQLVVFNLLQDSPPTEDELKACIEDISKVTVVRLRIKPDARYMPTAYVDFASPEDTRKALDAFNNTIVAVRGKQIDVKVPLHFYSIQDGPAYHSRSQAPSQPAKIASQNTGSTSRASGLVQYSPQDARSGLKSCPQAQDVFPASGSPEARKSNIQQEFPIMEVSEEPKATTEESVQVHETAEEEPNLAVNEVTHIGEHAQSGEQQATDTATSLENARDSELNMVQSVEAVSGADIKSGPNDDAVPAKSPQAPVKEISPDVVESTKGPLPPAPEKPVKKRPTKEKSVQRKASLKTPTQHPPLPKDSSHKPPAEVKPPQSPQTTVQEPSAQGPQIAEQTPGSNGIALESSHTEVANVSDTQACTEVAPDDEAKHDESFQSAKTTQSDLVFSEENRVPTPVVDPSSPIQSQAEDQGISPALPKSGISASPHLITTTPEPATTENQTGTDPDKEKEAPSTPAQPGTTENRTITDPKKQEKASIAPAQPDTAASGPETTQNKIITDPEMQKEAPSVPAQPATTAAKKPGVQKTESLFALKTKAQIKKEKEAKKKEKQKAKKAAVQGQPGQARSVSSRNGDAGSSEPNAEAPAITNPDVDPATIPSAPTANETEAREDKWGSAGGKNPVPLHEMALETQKPKVSVESSAQIPNQELGNTASSRSGSPSSLSGPDGISGVDSMPKPAVKQDAAPALEEPSTKAKDSQVQVKKSITNRSKVALPDLKLLNTNRKSSASEKPSDTASIASSTTVRGGHSQPPVSPSPTTDAYDTPLQTPSGLAPSASEAPKKKSKKKKKKAAGPSAPEATSSQGAGGAENGDDEEPFSDQMKEVDAAARRVKPQTSTPYKPPYYQEHPNQPEETPEQTKALDEKVRANCLMNNVSLVSSVSAYMRERAPFHKKAYEDSAEDSYYRRPELTMKEIDEITRGKISNPGIRILMNDDGSVPKAGERSFFTPKDD